MTYEFNKEDLKVEPNETWECCGVTVRTLQKIYPKKLSENGRFDFTPETLDLLKKVKGGYLYGHWLVEVVNVNLPEHHPFFGCDVAWHEIGCVASWPVGGVGSIWKKISKDT